MARVNEASHSFTCHPHVYPQMEWAIAAFTPSRKCCRHYHHYVHTVPKKHFQNKFSSLSISSKQTEACWRGHAVVHWGVVGPRGINIPGVYKRHTDSLRTLQRRAQLLVVADVVVVSARRHLLVSHCAAAAAAAAATCHWRLSVTRRPSLPHPSSLLAGRRRHRRRHVVADGQHRATTGTTTYAARPRRAHWNQQHITAIQPNLHTRCSTCCGSVVQQAV